VKAYRYLALAIAVLVVVQAGAIAWGYFGVHNFLNDGGVVDEEFIECREDCESFGGDLGFFLHMFIVGTILIPLCSVVLLVTSFFAKVPQGSALAAAIVVMVILQAFVLPVLSREVGAGFGALHGINALLIMGAASGAAARARKAAEGTIATAPAGAV